MPKYKTGTTVKTTKRYPRVTAGPLRNEYIHRIVAAALIGRDLTKDEQVHHKDKNRLNYHWSNLLVLGEKDHGWVSAKQAWFMKNRDEKEKKAFDEFMAEEAKRFDQQVQQAKADGQPWQNVDGKISERFYESVL